MPKGPAHLFGRCRVADHYDVTNLIRPVPRALATFRGECVKCAFYWYDERTIRRAAWRVHATPRELRMLLFERDKRARLARERDPWQ